MKRLVVASDIPRRHNRTANSLFLKIPVVHEVGVSINIQNQWNFPSELTMLPPRISDHLTKTQISGTRSLLLSCWSGMFVQDTPKPLQAIALGLHSPRKVEGKFQLLMTLCTSETGPRGHWTGKWPEYLLPEDKLSCHPKVPCKLSKGGSNQLFYSAMMSYQWAAWLESPRSIVVAKIPLLL